MRWARLRVERTLRAKTGPLGHSTRSVGHGARDRASRGSESQPRRACHGREDRHPLTQPLAEPEESNWGRRPIAKRAGKNGKHRRRRIESKVVPGDFLQGTGFSSARAESNSELKSAVT